MSWTSEAGQVEGGKSALYSSLGLFWVSPPGTEEVPQQQLNSMIKKNKSELLSRSMLSE